MYYLYTDGKAAKPETENDRNGRDNNPKDRIATQSTTTTCVPSFFRPRSRTTSEVTYCRALGLYFQQKLLTSNDSP